MCIAFSFVTCVINFSYGIYLIVLGIWYRKEKKIVDRKMNEMGIQLPEIKM